MTENTENTENIVIREKLKDYGQEQLLKFYDELDSVEKARLAKDIESVDFDLMSRLSQNALGGAVNGINTCEIKPIECIVSPEPGTQIFDEYYKKGLEVIRSGQVIAISLSGGQGSRLGHSGPKGTFDMQLASHKTIFEIQLDGLKELYEKTGTYIHWFIMTSELNNAETVEFFEKNSYFGYPKEKISFFAQGMIPVMSQNGKILLEEKDKILRSPDGNGGIFSALKKNRVPELAEAEGARYAFICNIDNCLVKMCDPLFAGCIALTGKACLTKTFMKRSPEEKAGVYCISGGKPHVVEYTEISKEMAEMKNPDGTYTYGDANVGNYIFDLKVLKNATDKGLPYHTAVKKVTCIGEKGEKITSAQPDSCKFEMFMFDIFDYIDNVAAFRIIREKEFAPVKNKDGEDSPRTARNLYMKQHKIAMNTPIVEMDGDEMARVIWKKVKEKVILPFVELNTEYYDLSIQNRDMTEDFITVAAAEATKRLGVAVKCATITPNGARMEEYGLKKLWKSPNGTIRGILDGTVFRKPILADSIEPVVSTWKKPITIARHAYGDIYSAAEEKVEKGCTVTMVVKNSAGEIKNTVIHEFKNSDGIVMGMHNETSSIESFAVSCFEYCLSENMSLWFSSKDTVSKTYDHTFKDIFQKIYDNKYREKFEKRGLTYFYTLVDDAISRVMRSEGGFVWACKNYDGDVFSDMLASAFGSLSMMSSVLVSPGGYFEYEAAHGTIPRHYKKYLAGEPTSTNPTATLFAWTGALKKRGDLDGNVFLKDFAERVEAAVFETIKNGRMTGDLAKISTNKNAVTLSLDEFLEEIAENIYN